MQREITHSCGHSHSHYVVSGYFAAETDAKVRKLARMKCPACGEACKAARAAKKARADSAALGDVELPVLLGSEKQIAWATALRLESLSALHRKDSAATSAFVGVTDARWWINNRGLDLRTVIPPLVV